MENFDKLFSVVGDSHNWIRVYSYLEINMMKDGAVYSRGDATSPTLLHRVRDHDAEGWVLMVTIYSSLILYWCHQANLKGSECEDVVQSVWKAVAQKIVDFEHNGKRGAFRKWLRVITRNTIADTFRSQLPMDGVGGSANIRSLEGLADRRLMKPTDFELAEETKLLYRRVWEAIQNNFSDRDSHLFRRVVVNGERPKDVAEDEGVTSNVVSIAVSRIKAKIRELIAPDSDD